MGVIRCLRLRGLRGLQDSGACLEGETRRLGSCPLSALPSLRLALLWDGVFSYPLATILCGGGTESRVSFSCPCTVLCDAFSPLSVLLPWSFRCYCAGTAPGLHLARAHSNIFSCGFVARRPT